MKITPRKPGKRKVEPETAESNVEMQAARGRLKGLLNEIMEEPNSPAPSEAAPAKTPSHRGRPKKAKREENILSNKPYVIKLFDRLVNVSQYDENSPLYPICRDWFYDRKTSVPKEPVAESTPTYYTGRESLLKQLQRGRIDRVAALPPPNDDEEVQKIPYCEPPAMENGLHLFTVDYDWDNPIVATEDLTSSYLERWKKVKQAWNLQSYHYFQRYSDSAKVLEAIKKN